jgi:Zn-dependent peptidase ImmA (M78 family)
LEQFVSDLDEFYDFPSSGIEGMTIFSPGKKPRVRISRVLALNPRGQHRRRTTIAHELGHVVLHTRLYDEGLVLQQQEKGDLAPNCAGASTPTESIDWLEWQAGYFSSLILIQPQALLSELRRFKDDPLEDAFAIGSPRADQFTWLVAAKFDTSVECAHVRLEKAGIIYKPLSQEELVGISSRPVALGLAHCGPVLERIVARYGLKAHTDSTEI